MKAESTIRKELTKLRDVIDEIYVDEKKRDRAYEMECALRWVMADRCDWTPASSLKESKP